MAMVRRQSGTGIGHLRGQQGLSFVELLVASLILLIIILGIIPLFVRSIINNAGGNDYSRLSNYSKSQVEEMFQLDFNNAQFDIPAGNTEASSDEYWSVTEKKWKPGLVPGGETTPWTRNTLVRQYNITAANKTIDDFDFARSSALDGNAPAESVHLKEIIVTVRAVGGSTLGPRRDIVLRTLKAK
jgi:hypothetical protein